METITLTYEDRAVALAAPTRFWLAAHIEVLPTGDPRKTHVCFMALYARDVLTGAAPGPYRDEDAERFARLAVSGPANSVDSTDVAQLLRINARAGAAWARRGGHCATRIRRHRRSS
jgi:hypothetical protein